jgi:hypothetical protein
MTSCSNSLELPHYKRLVRNKLEEMLYELKGIEVRDRRKRTNAPNEISEGPVS